MNNGLKQLRDLAKEYNEIFGLSKEDALATDEELEMWLGCYASYCAGKITLEKFNDLVGDAFSGQVTPEQLVRAVLEDYDA